VIFLDIETSGLDPRKNGILSIGACSPNGQQFYGECSLRAGADYSLKALEINGFTPEQIDDPDLQEEHELYSNFVTWCKELDEFMLCGENVGSFDVQFLKYVHGLVEDDIGKWPFGHRYIDLHTLAFLKLGKSMSMDHVREALGLPEEPAPHNALTGAQTARETWYRLLEIEG
jgi:DNA polymerase III epsilon subunit-like protein